MTVLTKERLIAYLTLLPEGTEIVDMKGVPFVHMSEHRGNKHELVLSTTMPIGSCNETGQTVFGSDKPEWDGYSTGTGDYVSASEFTRNET
jgi:hypothetical protein